MVNTHRMHPGSNLIDRFGFSCNRSQVQDMVILILTSSSLLILVGIIAIMILGGAVLAFLDYNT